MNIIKLQDNSVLFVHEAYLRPKRFVTSSEDQFSTTYSEVLYYEAMRANHHKNQGYENCS